MMIPDLTLGAGALVAGFSRRLHGDLHLSGFIEQRSADEITHNDS
jgi:hypothetical protein